jgi:hypothetical protein
VLLVADSLRYDAVFGGPEHLLPYAVSHGINFAQARSAGCWTLPATAALFTGWRPHDHEDARTVETQISTRGLFGALLKAAGDKEEAFFSLTASPERSISLMQSFWYDNRGHSQPRCRYNQFAFVAGTQRFAHRHGPWRSAPLTRHGDPEVAFQELGRCVDPLREAVDRPERLAYIRCMFEAYQAFAAGV